MKRLRNFRWFWIKIKRETKLGSSKLIKPMRRRSEVGVLPRILCSTPTGCRNATAVIENRLPVKGKRLCRAFGALDGHRILLSCNQGPVDRPPTANHFCLILRCYGVYTEFWEEPLPPSIGLHKQILTFRVCSG